MNIQLRDIDTPSSREEAAELLDRLRSWAKTAHPTELAELAPDLRALAGPERPEHGPLSRA